MGSHDKNRGSRSYCRVSHAVSIGLNRIPRRTGRTVAAPPVIGGWPAGTRSCLDRTRGPLRSFEEPLQMLPGNVRRPAGPPTLGRGALHRRRADPHRDWQDPRSRVQVSGGRWERGGEVPATIQDIAAWPIPGIVVFGGEGFSSNMVAYFHATGKAVALDELEPWLRLFFGLSS